MYLGVLDNGARYVWEAQFGLKKGSRVFSRIESKKSQISRLKMFAKRHHKRLPEKLPGNL